MLEFGADAEAINLQSVVERATPTSYTACRTDDLRVERRLDAYDERAEIVTWIRTAQRDR